MVKEETSERKGETIALIWQPFHSLTHPWFVTGLDSTMMEMHLFRLRTVNIECETTNNLRMHITRLVSHAVSPSWLHPSSPYIGARTRAAERQLTRISTTLQQRLARSCLMLLADCTNAFDRVWHKDLLAALSRQNFLLLFYRRPKLFSKSVISTQVR